MTQVEELRAQVAQRDFRYAAGWILSNWVMLAAALLIVVQLWLKGAVLAHAYFRQDDFLFMDQALRSNFGAHYLLTNMSGHMMPGGLAVVWMLARLSVYDWTLTSSVNFLLLAASSVAALRLLRTIFGTRPAILIPLAVYLFTPIMLPGLTYWATTLIWLPLQLVIFMALNAHITYVRSGQFWHAIVAAAWCVVGMLVDDPGFLVPLLLFALTTAFFSSGSLPQAALDVLRTYWRAWTLYGVLAAIYIGVFIHQLSTSTQQPTKPGQLANVVSFVATLLRGSFVPGVLGGPWRWLSAGDYGYAAELSIWTQLALVVVVIIIGASLWYRRRSERAWLILAGWIFLTAVAPLVIGRVALAFPTILGADIRYLADTGPVLAICLGLAFWPVAGEGSAYRSHPPVRLRQAGTAALLTVFVVGSLWSYHAYEAETSSVPERSYLATARAAVAGAPQGAVIVDSPTPQDVEAFFAVLRPYGYTSQVIGALASGLPGKHLRWTEAPSGVIANLMIFDVSGRLTYAAVLGRANSPTPGHTKSRLLGGAKSRSLRRKNSRPLSGRACWTAAATGVRIPIPGGTPMYYWPWTIELSYQGPSATLAVEFGGRWHDVQLLAGSRNVYVPALGAGSSIQAEVISGGPSECITHMNIGSIVPSYATFPIPMYALHG